MKPMPIRLLSSLLLSCTPILLINSSAVAETAEFDAAGELTNRFAITGTALNQTTSGGIADTGAVLFADSDVNGFATLQDASVDVASLENDFSIRQLIFFKTGSRTSGVNNNRRALNIGLTAESSVSYEAAGLLAEGAVYASLYVTNAAVGDGTMQAKLGFTTSNPDKYVMLTSTVYTLQLDSWYALEAVYAFPQTVDTLSVTVTLHSADAAGNLVSELGSASSGTTEAQALFGESPTLRGFFGTRSAGRTNVALVDNATLLELIYEAPPPPIDEPWRSSLYPEDWQPPQQRHVTFADDMMIQDFSYAGYHRGEKPLPDITGPLFNVTDYGADPTAASDSTAAIQSAIDAAGAAGGGVVFLPSGTYKVSVASSASSALLIDKSNVILRGAGKDATRIWNTTTNLRNKTVIAMDPSRVGSWDFAVGGRRIPVVQDILGPTTSVQVESVAGFSVGDRILIRNTTTSDWSVEHNVPEWAPGFNIRFLRHIIAIDTASNTLHLDIPLRYALKLRDNPEAFKVIPHLEEAGIEHLSIGNTENPLSGFGDNQYVEVGTAAYEVHNSWIIRIEQAVNCWVRNVGSFSPDGNAADHHILSNGINVREALNVTLQACDILYPQYGGGGGNGYLYRIEANETLLDQCSARFGRHNYVIAGFSSSGNVFYRCFSEFTGYPGSARASDTHIYLSQSNLWDNFRLNRDFLESKFRPTDTASGSFGTVFGVTQTHGVYWNTFGEAYLPGYPYIIRSDQYNFGYVIGTQGPANAVVTFSDDASRTAPVDMVEGVGSGHLLAPQSLYDDQLAKRLAATTSPFSGLPEVNGFKQVGWLGPVADNLFPWVFQPDLGWAFLLDSPVGDFYFHFDGDGYHYTNPDIFPFFFHFPRNQWLYFGGAATDGSRLYFNFNADAWESIP